MKKILFIALISFTSCEFQVEPGWVKSIPTTKNIIIGTDSTIVIVCKECGQTLNVIKR